MEAEQVANLLFRDPFVPVRVKLTDGDHFVIALPHRAHVTWDELIVGVSKDPFAPPEKRRRRFIPLDKVESIDDISLGRRRSRNGPRTRP
jgi:hypothetical protein